MKKQFDLNYYLAHPETKVVTRGGNKVRILCTDRKSPLCGKNIVALIFHEKGIESVYTFDNKGKPSNAISSDYDLFFDLPDPAKKKVALNYDDLVERVKAGKTMWLVTDGDTVFNIVDFDLEAVYYIHGKEKEITSYPYDYLLIDELIFVDGDPCWKEVEE